MLKKLTNKPYYILFSLLAMFYTTPALAAGLAKTKAFLNNISTELHGIAIIAFLIAAYCMGIIVWYRGQPFESVSKLVYGCLIFMIAPEAALMIFG